MDKESIQSPRNTNDNKKTNKIKLKMDWREGKMKNTPP